MAETFQITDAFRRELGRDPTGEEMQKAKNYSVGQLESGANIRALAGQQTTEDIYKESLRLAREANQPAIDTLQSQVEPLSGSFEAEATRLESTKTPLNQRYDQLISDIASNQVRSENRQTTATKNELGRRGISSLSGLGEQEVVNAVNPIALQYASLLKNAGLDREQALTNIDQAINQTRGAEQQALLQLKSQIATLQAGAGLQGLNLGTQMYQSQIQQNQFAEQQRLAEEEQARAKANDLFTQAFQEKVYNTIDLPTAQANLERVRSSLGSGATSVNWSDALTAFLFQQGQGQGGQLPSGQSSSSSSDGFQSIDPSALNNIIFN